MTLTPDAHGQAALMLCESLALLLIAEGVLPKNAVADAIVGVAEVKQEAAGLSESVIISVASIGLLRTIARSIAAAPSPGTLSAS